MSFMTGILIYRVFYECLTVSLKCSLQHLSSFGVLLVQPVGNIQRYLWGQ